MGQKVDLTGRPFGRLTVLCENGHNKYGRILWKCKCECGNICVVSGNCLTRKRGTRSCGCLHDEVCSEKARKHDLYKDHPRLLNTILLHFYNMSNNKGAYKDWSLDKRYTNNREGAVRFCKDIIALQPDKCALYETDKNLQLDKDDDKESIFRPESLTFVSTLENANNKRTTRRLSDGTPLTTFCRMVGVNPCENGKVTKTYSKYHGWHKLHGEGHPDLIKKANDLIALYSKCLKLLKLREEVVKLSNQIGITRLPHHNES